MGPRKKLNNAIARWHSNARPASGDLEQVYADRMEAEMQEMAIQLHRVSSVLQTLFRSIEITISVLGENKTEQKASDRISLCVFVWMWLQECRSSKITLISRARNFIISYFVGMNRIYRRCTYG